MLLRVVRWYGFHFVSVDLFVRSPLGAMGVIVSHIFSLLVCSHKVFFAPSIYEFISTKFQTRNCEQIKKKWLKRNSMVKRNNRNANDDEAHMMEK